MSCLGFDKGKTYIKIIVAVRLFKIICLNEKGWLVRLRESDPALSTLNHPDI